MTDQISIVDGAPLDGGKTSDQILAEIEATRQKEMSAQGDNSMSPAQTPSDAPGIEEAPKSVDKQPQPGETSQLQEEENAPVQSDKADDTEDWMKKKGFKSTKDILQSYRNLEKKLGQRGSYPPVSGQPSGDQEPAVPSPYAPQPSYRPNQTPYSIEDIAKRYNLPPEDFERVMPLINDATDLKMRISITPLMGEIARLKSEIAKEREMESLEKDPHFHNREVLKEMYQIVEKDPSILQRPDANSYAYKEALASLGRRYVEGNGTNIGTAHNNHEERLEIPSTPPPTGRGTGSAKGSSSRPSVSKMTPEKFSSLSSAEMEKYLATQGLIRKDEF